MSDLRGFKKCYNESFFHNLSRIEKVIIDYSGQLLLKVIFHFSDVLCSFNPKSRTTDIKIIIKDGSKVCRLMVSQCLLLSTV